MNQDSNEKLTESTPVTTMNTERRSSDWDIKNAPKNYLSLIITQGGSSVFAFLSVLLITKVLGSEGYGGVVVIIAASQIAQVLVNWTSTLVIRFGTEEFVATEKISRIFWVRLCIFLPNILLVFLTSKLWFPPLAEWLKLSEDSFYLVALHFVATALWIHVQYSLQGVKKQRLQGGLLAIERLIIFSGLMILWFYGSLSPSTAILFYAFSPLAMVFVGIWFLRKYIFSRFSIDGLFLRRLFLYSVPLLPFSLVGYFSGSYVDAVFISNFLSTQDLGIYSVATQINGLALQIPTLANSLLIPFFVTLQTENKNSLLNNYFKHTVPSLTLFWGIGCSLMAFGSYFVLPLMFGSEFMESVEPLWILLTGAVIALPGFIGYVALVHSSSTTYIATVTAVISAITNILFNFLLIPKYGMKGCAWATVITYVVGIMSFSTLLNRSVKVPISWIYPAMLPAILSAGIYTMFQNPLLALMVCILSTMIIVFVKKDSIKESLAVLKKVKNP